MLSKPPPPKRVVVNATTAPDKANTISLSRDTVLELCRGKELNALPPEVRLVMAGGEDRLLKAGNREMIISEATSDLSPGPLNPTENEDALILMTPVAVTGPKEICDVVGAIPVEVIGATPIELETMSHRILGGKGNETNDLEGQETRLLGDKSAKEHSQNQPRKDKQALKLKQVRTDSSPPRIKDRTAPKRSNVMSPPGGHMLR